MYLRIIKEQYYSIQKYIFCTLKMVSRRRRYSTNIHLSKIHIQIDTLARGIWYSSLHLLYITCSVLYCSCRYEYVPSRRVRQSAADRVARRGRARSNAPRRRGRSPPPFARTPLEATPRRTARAAHSRPTGPSKPTCSVRTNNSHRLECKVLVFVFANQVDIWVDRVMFECFCMKICNTEGRTERRGRRRVYRVCACRTEPRGSQTRTGCRVRLHLWSTWTPGPRRARRRARADTWRREQLNTRTRRKTL